MTAYETFIENYNNSVDDLVLEQSIKSVLLNSESSIEEINKLSGVCIAIAIAILICWKPAAIFVSLIFKIIPETIEQANETNKVSEKIEILKNFLLIITLKKEKIEE